MTPVGVERVWDAGRPVDLRATLAPLARGGGDPSHRFAADGFWWACTTPVGPGTLRLSAQRGRVSAAAWGEGAGWLLERVPALLGEDDDWSALSPPSPLDQVLRRSPGMRFPATGLVLDVLVPAVLEQRVTGKDARRAWRQLIYRYGTPAPGPASVLRVPPPPDVLLQVTAWDWHLFGVDLQRQRAIRAAASVASRLEECIGLPREEALRRLRYVPGIGEWTAAETAQRAWGDPDAVSVGDYHLKDLIVHYFTGRPRGSDAEMLALLEPWRGQRQRIVRLVELSGVGKPRFGPRYSPVDIRAI